MFYRPKEERAPYGPLSSRKEAPKIADSEQFEQAIKKRGAGGASSFLLGPRAHARGVLLLHVPPYFSAEFLERSARAYARSVTETHFKGRPFRLYRPEKGGRQRPPLMSEKQLLPTFLTRSARARARR